MQDLIGSEFHLEHIDEVQSRDAIKWFGVASKLFLFTCAEPYSKALKEMTSSTDRTCVFRLFPTISTQLVSAFQRENDDNQ